MARQLMMVDVESLYAAVMDAVIPARKAFAIFDAVGMPQSLKDANPVKQIHALKRKQDGKGQPSRSTGEHRGGGGRR